MIRHKFIFKSARAAAVACILSACLSPTFAVRAAEAPPTSGQLFEAAKAEAAQFGLEGATVNVAGANGARVIEGRFPAGDGYPAFAFPIAGGAWDLSAYSGVQAEVTNVGAGKVTVALRVDNAGDWKQNPFNTESVEIAPGETRSIKVTFGRSYGGNPGFALDASKVTGLRIFAVNPKAEAAVRVLGLKAVGAAAPASTSAASVAAASTSTGAGSKNVPPATGALFYTRGLVGMNTAAIRVDKARVVAAPDGVGVRMEFGAGESDYPTMDLPVPDGGWNLSAYSGVQAELSNHGAARTRVALRVDNAGDWKKEPFNTEAFWLAPGETKTLRVDFGRSHGNPGFALDAGKVTAVKVFAITPKDAGSIVIKSIAAVGKAAASTSPGIPVANAAPNLNTPAIQGELFPLAAKPDLKRLTLSQTTPTLDSRNGTPVLKVEFSPGQNQYPNLQFPIPPGGWNLAAFAGVQAEVTNPGAKPVTVLMRADNAGEWKESPWNTESITVGPGETKMLSLRFGQNNGSPGFPLNPERVTGIQVFMINPKEPATILIGDLKGFGSPADRADGGFTSPADRLKPVTLPAWAGSRPPVAGDWVQTLNENFDGNKLNEKVWRHETWWHGLLPGQTQRYSKDNTIIEGGQLKFKTEKRRGHQNDDPKLPQMDYTTGHIISYDKWTQKYGYFEARIKLPTARGQWPAFWMMPDRGPAAGPEGWKRESTRDSGMEIDILEHLTEWGPGRNNVAVHWDGYDKDHKSWGTSNVYFGPTPDGFHLFGVLWEPGKLTWFIDGKKTVEWKNERVGSVPAYLLLNVQMGGWATKDVDEAGLPDYTVVDWVRAWQLKERVGK
jgi:beta-glucanase (GH16 family)/uncharacterized cupredoxin-like copper-binding protein